MALSAPLLPGDLILEIFTWLPIKLLVRFRCVCKLWNSLLSDPDFTRSLSNRYRIFQNPTDDECLILFNHQRDRSPYFSIIPHADFTESIIEKFPCPKTNLRHLGLAGSINGLLCLTCLYVPYYHFVLWNPATRLYKTILVPYSERYKLGSVLLGFGWDSVTDNYKLIARDPYSSRFVVYSSNTGCWSEKVVTNPFHPSCGSIRGVPTVIVKGVPYWDLCDNSNILRFDVRVNEFTYLKVSYEWYGLLNLNDSLAVMQYFKDRADVYCFDEECHVWNKIYTINKEISISSISACFKYGGEIVLKGKNELYDPKSDEIKSLVHHERRGFFVYGYSYTPSPVAVEGMKSLHA